jgi:hypothetical protein
VPAERRAAGQAGDAASHVELAWADDLAEQGLPALRSNFALWAMARRAAHAAAWQDAGRAPPAPALTQAALGRAWQQLPSAARAPWSAARAWAAHLRAGGARTYRAYARAHRAGAP